MINVGTGDSSRSEPVEPGGAFTLRDVPAGDYTLSVINDSGTAIASVQVRVAGVNATAMNAPVVIDLPRTEGQQRFAGSVSVSQLRHKPSKIAMRSEIRAQQYKDSGDLKDAIKEAQKSVAADPDWAMAHANLGTYYLRLSRYEDAVAEMRKAIALDPGTAGFYWDLALAFGGMQDLAHAIPAAHQAIRLAPGNPMPEYVLGSLLSCDPATRELAIPHLEIAARQMPRARALLDQIAQKHRK